MQHSVQPPQEAPDIALVIADDLGWEDVADGVTPALDLLAAQGISFAGFHSMPNCSPTRLALLTGRYPRRLGVGEVLDSFAPQGPGNPGLGPELVTLPRLLKARGYTTCLVGKWHGGEAAVEGELADHAELSALAAGGFDHWLAGAPENLSGEGGSGYTDWLRVDDWKVTGVEHDYATAVQVSEAVRWWRTAPRPRFLVLALNTPHVPLHDPPPELLRDASVLDGTRTGQYLAMVQTVDWAVEQVRDELARDDWLFFVSDNGTPPSTNGSGQRAKGTTFRRGVEVPLIVAGPRVAQVGVSVAGFAQATDLYATIAELAGIALPTRHGGEDARSLVPAFGLGAAWPGRPYAFSERYPNLGTTGIDVDERMLRDARWKLRVVRNAPDLMGYPGPPRDWLYDLSSDPDERAGVDALHVALDAEQGAAYARLLHELETLPPRKE